MLFLSFLELISQLLLVKKELLLELLLSSSIQGDLFKKGILLSAVSQTDAGEGKAFAEKPSYKKSSAGAIS